MHTAMHAYDAESKCPHGQHLNFAPSMENAFKAPFGRSSSNCMSRESCTNRTHLPEWWCHVQSTGSGSTPPSPTRSLPVSANSSITEVNTELSHLVVHVYNGKARNARKCSITFVWRGSLLMARMARPNSWRSPTCTASSARRNGRR